MFLPRSYLRSCRKRAGLTQRDIAFLVAQQNGSVLSEVERGKAAPSLRVMIAYQLLFDVSPAEAYPRKTREVEELLRIQAGALAEELEQREQTRAVAQRVAFLRELERELWINPPSNYGKESY